ncbi:MAG: hypothetical protein AVO35_12965 [Candidatus Aegiribacteria sp. MLS_C]|nr:MAG: hypothetical protein AVO35_12965 [Candidatus Aegiribacteria sp. MLS_C]
MIFISVLVLVFTIAYAEPLLGNSVDADSSSQRLSFIGFEEFENGLPVGMDSTFLTRTGNSSSVNLFERDSTVYLSGNSSLRISANDSTDQWYYIELDIPGDFRCITATISVKASGLHRSGNQYDNCIIGFLYNGLEGNRTMLLEQLPRDDYDWTEASVSLNTETEPARSIRFIILSSISGTLWVDDLSFTYDDDCEAIPMDRIRGPLAEYIGDLHRPAPFMEIPPQPEGDCPDSISAAEFSEDMELLKYLIEYGYSGYTYWSSNGVDFDSAFDSLEALARSGNSIAVLDFERLTADGFSGIQDGHLTVKGHETHRFLDRTNPYFASVIVELSQCEEGDSILHGQYVVIQSRYDSVQPGMIYTGPEERMFRILARQGSQQYQLGVFSDEDITEASFPFNTDPGSAAGSSGIDTLKLPLHECNLTARTDDSREGVYYRTLVDGIELIRVRSFSSEYHDTLSDFIRLGDTLAATDRFIVDLTGNRGGNSNYAKAFIQSLNGVAQWRMNYAMLCSPATMGAVAGIPATEDSSEDWVEYINYARNALELLRENPVRNWIIRDESLPPRQMGNYNGQAVFLVDRRVASSGEAFIDYAMSIPGAVRVGENSAGVGIFGHPRYYWLPNSRIQIYIPFKLYIAPGYEEGVGYMPDYWLDSPEPIHEITEWMNNPESYQFELPERGL